MKFDLVIFDCDGVVVDSEFIVNKVAAELKTELGYKITTEAVSYTHLTLPTICSV